MPNRILNSDTYHDEVRSKIGVTADVLPDPLIDAPTVVRIAEARLIDRVSAFCDYTTLKDDDQAFLYAAAVSMAAAILAPTMGARILKSEGDADYKYTTNDVDWTNRARDLEEEAYSYLDYISVQPVTELKMMAATGPTRSNGNKGGVMNAFGRF